MRNSVLTMQNSLNAKPNLENYPGSKNLLLHKLSCAVVCSVAAQGFFLVAYLFLSNFNPWHPGEWLLATFSTLSTFSTWIYLIPLASIIFAQSVICAKDYVYKSTHGSTRFKKLCLIFTLRNVFICVLHVIVGGLIVWLHLSLSGGKYENIAEKCFDDKSCLIEGSLFIILNGFWIGVYYFVKVYVSGEKYMIFPVIQLKKLPMFKSRIGSLLKNCFKDALWPTYLYFASYYLWGASLKVWIGETFNLHIQESSSYEIFLNISVLAYAWLFSVLYMFNMNCMRLFFELFLTEQIKFPVEITGNELCLPNAISMDNLPVVQHLATLDFYLLASKDSQRRQQLYMLSQPGGHPHNWNSIISPALKLLNDFTALLNSSTETLLSTEQNKPQDVQTNVPVNVHPSVQSPLRYGNIRNMSMIRDEPIKLVTAVPGSLDTVKNQFILKCANRFNQTIETMKCKLGWKYLFGELPEANVRLCLSNGQTICWTAQGLSFICSASYTEDTFGVVQKDLMAIITCLVHLKKSIDKLFKLNRKGYYNDFQLKMRFALKSSVRRSLYNITKTYGNYLNDLPLSPDVRQQMENYVACKEG